MNPPSDTDPPPSVGTPGVHPKGEVPFPASWSAALLALLSSRIALIDLEARQAVRDTARRAIFFAGVAMCIWFMWALLLAGLIAGLARCTAWPWYGIAIGAAMLHLTGALLLIRAARAAGPPAFPVTRAEFKKDREWLEHIQKTPKSGA